MDISDWQDNRSAGSPRSDAETRFFPPTFFGVAGALLLHAFILQSVVISSLRLPPQVRESRSLAGAASASTEGLTVVALLDNSPRSTQIRLDSIFLNSLNQSTSKIPVDADLASPLNIPLALNEAEGAQVAASARAETARLAGIYSGQIQARIERAWRRPRTPVNESEGPSEATDESFQCDAQIVQDDHGKVLEVMLPRCAGSVVWQESLLLAIRQASPLPAPPSEQVFAPSIALRFIGFPYSKDSMDDEYESD